MGDRLPRKLAAILYADVAGYSRLTGEVKKVHTGASAPIWRKILVGPKTIGSKFVKFHAGSQNSFASGVPGPARNRRPDV